MSYDLAIWVGPRPVDDAAALTEYERRMDALEDAGEGDSEPVASAIQTFVDEALERFPAAEVDEDEDDDQVAVWSTPPFVGDTVGDLAYVTMTFPGAEVARDPLAEIAASLGLVCFDPQLERLLPAAEATSASAIRAAAERALLRVVADHPVLHAYDDTEAVARNPSEADLLQLLDGIESRGGGHLVVEDLRDREGQFYAQTRRRDDGTYEVEYRGGGPERHFATIVDGVREAHAILGGWAVERRGWRGDHAWERLDL